MPTLLKTNKFCWSQPKKYNFILGTGGFLDIEVNEENLLNKDSELLTLTSK